MKTGRLLLSLAAASMLVSTSLAAPATGPTTKKAKTKKGKEPEVLAAEAAVAALAKEYQNYLADPKQLPRAKSDYFTKGAKGTTPNAVLNVLLFKRLDDDPRVAGYVGWQMLSIIPDRVEGEMAGKVAWVLRGAPRPKPVFGLKASDQQQLIQSVNRCRSDAELAPTNEKLAEAIERSRADSAPIIAYRDALASRLPLSAETYSVKIDDLIYRAQVGADVAGGVSKIAASIRDWSATEARVSDRLNVMSALNHAASQQPPEYIKAFAWSEKKFTVVPTMVKDPFKSLKTLADEIAKDRGDGGGNLGFKDEKSGSKQK